MSKKWKCSSSSAGAQEKGKIGDETSFCTKISAKPSFASFLISFVKNSTPTTDFVPYYGQTCQTRPLIAWLYK
jgi:hypothetical protein